ncbi:hypothetical protein GYH30_040199 [Glycine max]|uniref:Uncharacterized protein n=1 Tax=Glycine max TaxID=3847 RepID=I1MAG6_SOYBN|nr:hypothetical protein GYH30_040199 [Glycine max]
MPSFSMLHHTPIMVEAMRRYHDFWMSLIADLMLPNSSPPTIFPPLDIHWVWFCHTLNLVSYREYCETRFSKLIGKAGNFDEENREYALMWCREIWSSRYPLESFETRRVRIRRIWILCLFKELEKQRVLLCSMFVEPYRSEVVYLIVARQRYKAFLFMLLRFARDFSSRLVPTSDILLMWLTHQSYPTVYCEDLKALAIEGDLEKVATLSEKVKEKEFEETKKLWDRVFNQPYEIDGGEVPLMLEDVISIKSPIYWEDSGTDVNTKYRMFELCCLLMLDYDHDFIINNEDDRSLSLQVQRNNSCFSQSDSNVFHFTGWVGGGVKSIVVLLQSCWVSFVRYLGERKVASSGPR